MSLANNDIANSNEIESVENEVIQALLIGIAAQLNNHPYLYEALGASEREKWLYGPIVRAIHCLINNEHDFILTEAPIDYSGGIRFVDILFSLRELKTLFLLEVKMCGMSARGIELAETNLLKGWKNGKNGVVDQLKDLDKHRLNRGNNLNVKYLRENSGINSAIRVPILICSYSVMSNSSDYAFEESIVNELKKSAKEKHQEAIILTGCKTNWFSVSQRICTTGRNSGVHQVIANGMYAGAKELRSWYWK